MVFVPRVTPRLQVTDWPCGTAMTSCVAWVRVMLLRRMARIFMRVRVRFCLHMCRLAIPGCWHVVTRTLHCFGDGGRPDWGPDLPCACNPSCSPIGAGRVSDAVFHVLVLWPRAVHLIGTLSAGSGAPAERQGRVAPPPRLGRRAVHASIKGPRAARCPASPTIVGMLTCGPGPVR